MNFHDILKLDGCIVWTAHNTVLGSKRFPICTCHLPQCRLRWGLPPYQVAFWSIQPFGHNRHRPKFRGCCSRYVEAGFPSNTMWSGPTGTSIVHTKWHVDPSSHLTTIDMGQKVGGCCSLVTCRNCTVKIWTVINWTVITNRNPNRNRSPNLVLTVQISTIQISPGNFTVQNLIAQISYGHPCMLGSVYTSGSGHIIPVTACRESYVQEESI